MILKIIKKFTPLWQDDKDISNLFFIINVLIIIGTSGIFLTYSGSPIRLFLVSGGFLFNSVRRQI